MSTEIVKTLTATEINTLQAQADAIAASATYAVPANTFVFFAAFDGTKNIRDDPGYSNDPQSTAVGELPKQESHADRSERDRRHRQWAEQFLDRQWRG